ncbi:MAG: hypothetical protein ACYC27_20555 [Armatimonadota bacterium]
MKTKKLIFAGSLLALMMCFAEIAYAQATDVQGDAGLTAFKKALAGSSDPGPGMSSSAGFHERGVPASDNIKGNGSKAGYSLSHGALVADSDTVTVGGTVKRRNKDYYLDYSNGTLVFAEPVRTIDVVRVLYRYVPEKEGQRNTLAMPTLALRLGARSTLGITYVSNAAVANQAYDMLTYGLNLTTNLGEKSSMSNMLYMSTPQDSGRISLAGKTNGQPKPEGDNMFIHNSTLQSGKLSVQLNYQDVGKNFSGFTALKQQKVAADALLSQLEKEKGLKRMGFQANMNMGKETTSGLAWSQIGDATGEITKQSFKIGDGKLKFSADMQKVDKGFTRFNDLAEGERGQWAKEKGIQRSNIQLGMAPLKGMAKDSAWNTLQMNTFGDESGKLSTRSLNLNVKGLAISTRQMSADEGFKRMADLSNEEKTDMALQIRKQFDPNATAANVTDQDRAQIGAEAGIDRRNTQMSFKMGDKNVQLGMLDIGDKTGGVTRQSLAMQGKTFKITGFLQEIDKDFGRLSYLAPIEQQNFANEKGLRRMNFGGDFALRSGMQLATSMSRVSSETGSLLKYGLNLNTKKFNVSANYMDMDPEFTRVMDLADAQKGQLASEQGMKRYDVTAHLQASKSITIDSFLYDARHATSDLFKRQLRNNVTFNPTKGPKMTMLMDQISYGSGGSETNYSHENYTLNHKIGKIDINAMRDSVSTESPTSTNTTDVTTLHFNTDAQRRTAIVGDWKLVEKSDGKFEDTQTLKLNTKLNSKMAFIGSRTSIRTNEMEFQTQDYGVSGKVFGKLSLAAKYGDTLVNGLTVGKTRELSLIPDAPKDYGMFKQVGWQMAFGQVVKNGKIETENKTAKLDTQVLKHKISMHYIGGITKEGKSQIVRTFSVIGDQDPKKKLQYNMAYKVRDIGTPKNILIRNYNADWKVTSFTNLVYNYASYKEKADGTLEPVGIERVRLTTALSKKLGFVGQWERNSNYQAETDQNTLSVGISGKLSAKEVFEVGYGFDSLSTKNGDSESRTYKLKYDHQVDADHYLTLSGTYTDRDGPKPANINTDDVQYQIDFKTVFN